MYFQKQFSSVWIMFIVCLSFFFFLSFEISASLFLSLYVFLWLHFHHPLLCIEILQSHLKITSSPGGSQEMVWGDDRCLMCYSRTTVQKKEITTPLCIQAIMPGLNNKSNQQAFIHAAFHL